MSARLLVIGRSGQLAEALAASPRIGAEVQALGRDALDAASAEAIEAALAAVRPDGVVNAAAYTAVDKAETEQAAAFALNRDAPAALANACLVRGLPLVHVSTDYVFDGEKGAPYGEADVRNPLNIYGASKAAGEDAVLDSGARAAVIRTSWVYSWGRPCFLRTMLRLAAEGREEIGVVDDQWGRPTSAADLAAACWLVMSRLLDGDRDSEGLLHFAGSGDASWADFAEAIFAQASALGLPAARVRRIASSDYPTPARRPRDTRLDTGRFATLAGSAPQPWRAALEACMKGAASV